LLNQCRQEVPDLIFILDSRLRHNQFRSWVDANALAVGTDERELASGSWKQPNEIAIAEYLHGLAGGKGRQSGDCVEKVRGLLSKEILIRRSSLIVYRIM
jgi:hypothetical protein